MNENCTVYLGNIIPECTEKDLYHLFKPFGSIKRIKIITHRYKDYDYPIGFGFIEFAKRLSKEECISQKHSIVFKNNLLHIHRSRPDTKLDLSIFIFFSSEKVTKEYLKARFRPLRTSEISVKMNYSNEHLGFAIVKFVDLFSYEASFKYSIDSPFEIVKPDLPFYPERVTGISFQFNHINPTLDANFYEKFLDLNLIHCGLMYPVNLYLSYNYSTRIQHLYLSNNLLTSVHSRITEEGPFDLIASTLLGQEIEVTPENSRFLYLLSCDFGIEDLINTSSQLLYPQLNLTSSLKLFNDLISIDISTGPHIRYLSTHINELIEDKSLQTELQPTLVNSILYYHLKYIKDPLPPDFMSWLYDYIQINPNERNKMIQFMDSNSLTPQISMQLIQNSNININIIRNQLVTYLNKDVKSNIGNYQIINCHQKLDNPSEGVFSYLCKSCNGNPQDFNLIRITSHNSKHLLVSRSKQKDNDVDHNAQKYWSTPDIPNSWVCFNFKEYEIIPTGYMMRTFFDKKLPSMHSWRVDGSSDGIHWFLLDERRSTMNTKDHIWAILDVSKPCKYIKITQIDKNGSGNYCMFLFEVEFFGTLPLQNERILPNNNNKGVFDYITRIEQGNPYELGKIDITSSCDPKYLVEGSSCWRSPRGKETWIKIDLLQMKVKLDLYALRSHYGSAFFKSWKVEVSNDDKNYTVVDMNINRENYKRQNQECYWPVLNMLDPARFIKITLMDVDNAKTVFWLSHIELFGDLFRPLNE